jgi:hypothetical protein
MRCSFLDAVKSNPVGFSVELFRPFRHLFPTVFPTVIHLFSRLLFQREFEHAWLIPGPNAVADQGLGKNRENRSIELLKAGIVQHDQ